MNHAAQQPFAALIGIDWANAKHDICLRAAGSEAIEHSVVKHSPEAIDAWVRELRQRFGPTPIAIALELDKGPLVYALQKHDGLVLFPVNPTTLRSIVKRSRLREPRTIQAMPSSRSSCCCATPRRSKGSSRKARRCALSCSSSTIGAA